MEKKIGPFKLYEEQPCDMQYGRLYTMDVILPVPNCKKRTVRVYLPEGIRKGKRYPVMYMTDGQNIVDKYTTAYGAWDIDIKQHELLSQGYKPVIIVGIDCPKVGHTYRAMEYSLMDVPLSKRYSGKDVTWKAYSDLLMDYVVNKLKPLVDKYFPTLPDRENTAIGGSSMGGIAAFNFITHYPDVFGFALSFSPAFHIYQKKEFKEYVDSLDINPERIYKVFFYTGDVEFEHLFLKPTLDMYQYFRKSGFPHEQVKLIVDTSKPHQEASWRDYFPEAIKFWQEN